MNSVNDGIYVQSTMGVLPEAVSDLYKQEQTTAEKFPLSRASAKLETASNAKEEDEALFGLMEKSALERSLLLAEELELASGQDKKSFAGFMATILMEMGGEAFMVGGNKKGGVLKNVSSLLSKSNLGAYRTQLPQSVRIKLDNGILRKRLAALGIVWLKEMVASANEKLRTSIFNREDNEDNEKIMKKVTVPDKGAAPVKKQDDDDEEEDVDADDKAEGIGMSYLRFNNRIEELLEGNRDRLYEVQLDEQGSGLDPENPVKGAASGKTDINGLGNRSRAIPFEVRGPNQTVGLKPDQLPEYAQTVMGRLLAVNDPHDDKSGERELALVKERNKIMALEKRRQGEAQVKELSIETNKQVTGVINHDPQIIDDTNMAVFGKALSNIAAIFYNRLPSPLEKGEFWTEIGKRYPAGFDQYLLTQCAGMLGFMALQFEDKWMQDEYIKVMGKEREVSSAQQYHNSANSLLVSRKGASVSVSLRTKATAYESTLDKMKPHYQNALSKRYKERNFDKYVWEFISTMNLTLSAEVTGLAMSTLEEKELAVIDNIYHAFKTGQDVAAAIYAKAGEHYHKTGAKKAEFWGQVTGVRYKGGFEPYVVTYILEQTNYTGEDVRGKLGTFKEAEFEALSKLADVYKQPEEVH